MKRKKLHYEIWKFKLSELAYLVYLRDHLKVRAISMFKIRLDEKFNVNRSRPEIFKALKYIEGKSFNEQKRLSQRKF